MIRWVNRTIAGAAVLLILAAGVALVFAPAPRVHAQTPANWTTVGGKNGLQPVALNVSANGGLVGDDPCLSPGVPKSSVAIGITSATTTSLVATSGTTVIYPCGGSLTISQVVTTANTFKLEFGTGASCVTTQTPITGTYGAGGVTAGIPIVVPIPELGPSAAGAALCAVTTIGGSGSFQGVLTYVQK
jgi:hypothetical protein